MYYNTCAEIDQRNRHRKDTLCIERKLQTKTWDKRVATSIFGMYCLYVWLIYCGYTIYLIHTEPQLNQQQLYYALAQELIDNNIRL